MATRTMTDVQLFSAKVRSRLANTSRVASAAPSLLLSTSYDPELWRTIIMASRSGSPIHNNTIIAFHIGNHPQQWLYQHIRSRPSIRHPSVHHRCVHHPSFHHPSVHHLSVHHPSMCLLMCCHRPHSPELPASEATPPHHPPSHHQEQSGSKYQIYPKPPRSNCSAMLSSRTLRCTLRNSWMAS